MSRTDKDKPYWVNAEYYVPVHSYCQFDNQNWGWHRFLDGPRECDLPARPVYGRKVRLRWSQVESWTCTWKAEWPWKRRYPYCWGPRPIDRNLYWYGPDRARARDACGRARKEYNANGQTEVEGPTFQHRHAMMLSGGYWD